MRDQITKYKHRIVSWPRHQVIIGKSRLAGKRRQEMFFCSSLGTPQSSRDNASLCSLPRHCGCSTTEPYCIPPAASLINKGSSRAYLKSLNRATGESEPRASSCQQTPRYQLHRLSSQTLQWKNQTGTSGPPARGTTATVGCPAHNHQLKSIGDWSQTGLCSSNP